VRLLGPVDLQLDDRTLPPLDSARAESLLAYLLLHRDVPQPRQRLAFLLWPGSGDGQAQTNLRKVLHNLRRALPDADRLIEIGPRPAGGPPRRWSGSPASTSRRNGGPKPSTAPNASSRAIRCARSTTGC
jgi:hypothetical protein